MNFHSHAGGKGRAGGFAPALAASVVLHLLILWPALPANVPQRAAQPLAAVLRPGAAPAPGRPQAAAAPVRPQPRIRPLAREADGPASPPPPSAAAKPAAAATDGVPSDSAGTRAAQAPSVAASAGAEAPEPMGLDADGLRAYRIDLARGARAHKSYPPLAQERGWTGTAEVRIAVSGEGRPLRIALTHSSGHELLDREALSMMTRAAAAAAVPASLRGREFAVSLPVVFELAGVQ